MTSNSQPAQSMDKPHPDEMVQARRERIKRARVAAETEAPSGQATLGSVSVPLETWQEVVRLARLGQSTEPAEHLVGTTELALTQRHHPDSDALSPPALEMRRLAAMVEALRRRPSAVRPDHRPSLPKSADPQAPADDSQRRKQQGNL